MKSIKTTANDLAAIYEIKYREWCIENPGKIMNGSIIKVDVFKKASYCETLDEIKSMRVYYRVALRSADGPNGFWFSIEAIDELLNELDFDL